MPEPDTDVAPDQDQDQPTTAAAVDDTAAAVDTSAADTDTAAADADEPTEEQAEQRQPLNVTVEDAGPARKSLSIEVPAERIKKKLDESYDKLQDDAAVPGFRRGRAPMRLIEKRFGSAIRDDVRGQLLAECYEQAVDEEKLEVIGEPDAKGLDDIELPDDGPMTFKVEVEVVPAFELPSLDGIAVEKPMLEVTNAMIDAALEQLQQRHGRLKDMTDGGAKDGDYLQADVWIMAGKDTPAPQAPPEPKAEDQDKEDDPLIDYMPNTYVHVHGDTEHKGHIVGILVDDLAKQLAGAKPGQTVSITMTGPEGHENDRVKDKPITIHVRCHDVQRLEPATVDSILEQSGIESQDQLKDELRQRLEADRDRDQQVQMHRQVSDHLLENVDLELPEGLSSRQTARLLHRQAMELAYAGMSEKEVEQKIAELRNESESEARKQLKLFFILEKAAKQLEIDVDEGELNSRIAMMAMQQGRRPEKLRQEMMRSGRFEQLYVAVRDQKTLDAVVARANVTEVEPPKPETPAKKTKKKTSKKASDPQASTPADAEASTPADDNDQTSTKSKKKTSKKTKKQAD